MKSRFAVLAATLSATALFAAIPASAQQAAAGRTSVRHSDLDLASEAGRAELGKRYEQAAREMCGVRGEKAAAGRERYCYDRTSKQLAQRVTAILREHDTDRASSGG